MKSIKNDLRAIFQAGLDAVAGETAVQKAFLTDESPETFPKCFHVIAIGKAAESMASGVPSERILSGLIISKHDHISTHLKQNSVFYCVESDHPVPKEASLKAGEILINYLENLPEQEPCLFLISGGASALVEILQDNWDLAELQALTDYLLANAYPINEMNVIRQRLSRIKGGGLWSYLGERTVSCLIVSDVPDDDPAIIGSGLLFPVEEKSLPSLPEKWDKKISVHVEHKQSRGFSWEIIASLDVAKEAAAKKAKQLGYSVSVAPEFLDKSASETAIECVKQLRKSSNVLHVWGGETTVHLPDNAGMGGRNQHLALAAAIEIDGDKSITLLSAGTDGTDGLTTATGALVDSQTVGEGSNNNKDAEDFLLRADSNSFFQEIDCLIETGATGTNVMDLILGISIQS